MSQSAGLVKAAQVCSTPTLPGRFAHQSENQSESETMPYAACLMPYASESPDRISTGSMTGRDVLCALSVAL